MKMKMFSANDSVEEMYNKIISEKDVDRKLVNFSLATLSFNERKGTGNKLKKLTIKIKKYNRELYDQALKEGIITEVKSWTEKLINNIKTIIVVILFFFLLDVGCQAIS